MAVIVFFPKEVVTPGIFEEDNDFEKNSLIIEDVVEGDGDVPNLGDTVLIHYVGTFQDGTKFDSSLDRDTPLEFTVGAGEVITGLELGIQNMRVGGKMIIIIPPALAYGDRTDLPGIPPGSTLFFEVELLEILN